MYLYVSWIPGSSSRTFFRSKQFLLRFTPPLTFYALSNLKQPHLNLSWDNTLTFFAPKCIKCKHAQRWCHYMPSRSCQEKLLKQKSLKLVSIYLCTCSMQVWMYQCKCLVWYSCYHWIVLCVVAPCCNLWPGIISIALRKLVIEVKWRVGVMRFTIPGLPHLKKNDAIFRLRVLGCPETILHRSEQFEVAKKKCRGLQSSQAEFYPRISILLFKSSQFIERSAIPGHSMPWLSFEWIGPGMYQRYWPFCWSVHGPKNSRKPELQDVISYRHFIGNCFLWAAMQCGKRLKREVNLFTCV